MSQGRIKIISGLVEQFMQLPEGWKLTGASFEQNFEGFYPNPMLLLTIEGEGVQEGDYTGTFQSKTIEREDGTWMQGAWSVDK